MITKVGEIIVTILLEKGLQWSADWVIELFKLPKITDFRVIGPQSSGKTTYLAALAYLSKVALSDKSPVERIIPCDSTSQKLLDMAENLLKKGDRFEATSTGKIIDYGFYIKMRPKYIGKKRQIEVKFKDIPGEVLNTSISEEVLKDINQAGGLLLIIDPSSKQDTICAQWMRNLQIELENRLGEEKMKAYRIACVFSKAEMIDFFTILDEGDPKKVEKFMTEAFPQTQQALKNWKNDWKCSIAYFSCSAFGWTGPRDRRQPNYKLIDQGDKGIQAVIKNPHYDLWKPARLIQPLYWLQTGRRHKELESHDL